ncbi:MAG: hypothetical protein MJH10_08635 [Epibacterium sp.]|nr:hypothetical protein [Epibacterium sp.]NQX73603.1 hypothetical protein [Epibacterium sp.]
MPSVQYDEDTVFGAGGAGTSTGRTFFSLFPTEGDATIEIALGGGRIPVPEGGFFSLEDEFNGDLRVYTEGSFVVHTDAHNVVDMQPLGDGIAVGGNALVVANGGFI